MTYCTLTDRAHRFSLTFGCAFQKRNEAPHERFINPNLLLMIKEFAALSIRAGTCRINKILPIICTTSSTSKFPLDTHCHFLQSNYFFHWRLLHRCQVLEQQDDEMLLRCILKVGTGFIIRSITRPSIYLPVIIEVSKTIVGIFDSSSQFLVEGGDELCEPRPKRMLFSGHISKKGKTGGND